MAAGSEIQLNGLKQVRRYLQLLKKGNCLFNRKLKFFVSSVNFLKRKNSLNSQLIRGLQLASYGLNRINFIGDDSPR